MISPCNNFCKGVIIGMQQRSGDLEVNACKAKQLKTMCASRKDTKTALQRVVNVKLDACVEYLSPNNILEITPTKTEMAKIPDVNKKKSRSS